METRKDKDALTQELKDLLNTPVNFANPKNMAIIAIDLIRQGADSNTKSDNGDSLLHHLMRSHCFSNYIQTLIDTYKADVDIRDANNRTPTECLLRGDYGIFPGVNEQQYLQIFAQAYHNRGADLHQEKKIP